MEQDFDPKSQGVAEGVQIIPSPVAEPQAHVHGPNCSHSHGHAARQDPLVRLDPKIGRNDPCPCGSQQKFKKCHGK